MIEAIIIEIDKKVTFNTVTIKVLIEPIEKEKYIAHTLTAEYQVFLRAIFVNIRSTLTEHLHSVNVERGDLTALPDKIFDYLKQYDIEVVGYKNQDDDFPRMIEEKELI